MALRPEPGYARWPKSLPAQTALQKCLHAPHRRQRTAIVAALTNTNYPDMNRIGARLADCCTTALIRHSANASSTRPWLPRCGSRLCPFCGRSRSARIAEQLQAHIETMKAPRHITLTFRSRTEDLGVQLNMLRAAFSKLRRHKEWAKRVTGGLYTIEITRNAQTGLWHPHLHVVVDGEYFPQPLLAKLWSQHMPGGEHVWITKVDASRNAAWELAKYVGKPPDAEHWTALAILHFAMATQGTRMLQTFGNLHGVKLPEPDEKPAEQPDDRFVSVPHVAYMAAQGQPHCMDIAALLWARWPMFRHYLEETCPVACNATALQVYDQLPFPRPPPLDKGRYAPYSSRADVDALDMALDYTLLSAFCEVDAGRLQLEHDAVAGV